MKFISYIIPAASVAFICGAKLPGCSNDKKNTCGNLPEEVKPVAIAILNDSPSEFASVVSYPVERPYPLKNVEDSAEMVKYYPTLVDDTIRKAVEEAPDSAWQQIGWRGWTLGDGSYFWIDSGKIYEVTYVSEREHIMLDSLQNVEIATLDPSLQAGWTPVACVKDTESGEIFRIDTQDATNPPIYRLAGYSSEESLSGQPSIVLYGTLDLEGSMGNRFFRFSDDAGTTAEYSPDMVSDEEEPEIEIDRKGTSHRYKAKPDYWLDHIKTMAAHHQKHSAVNNADSVKSQKMIVRHDSTKSIKK